jgi:transcriptional regulator with XRE-family HTH domain
VAVRYSKLDASCRFAACQLAELEIESKLPGEGAVMDDGASPLMLRRRLRSELRAARLKRDLTQDQVAKAMDWSLSKMNRIEKAKTGISTNDLKALLPFYGITDEKRTKELLDLARASRQPPWWQQYSDVAPATLLELIDYESAASVVNQFEPMFVPGILQTEEYATALLRVLYGGESSVERVPALVDLRTRRRELLAGGGAARFSFVLDESVIRRTAGTPDVTSRQLVHLASLADLPNVSIRVVPFAAGLHSGMRGAFKIIEFDDAPDENIVFLEGPHGDLIREDPGEVKSYLATFKRITEIALAPSESIDLLRKTAGETA